MNLKGEGREFVVCSLIIPYYLNGSAEGNS
jgi:hypothetical protein